MDPDVIGFSNFTEGNYCYPINSSKQDPGAKYMGNCGQDVGVHCCRVHWSENLLYVSEPDIASTAAHARSDELAVILDYRLYRVLFETH